MNGFVPLLLLLFLVATARGFALRELDVTHSTAQLSQARSDLGAATEPSVQVRPLWSPWRAGPAGAALGARVHGARPARRSPA